MLKLNGWQISTEGTNLIQALIMRMNDNRLSSNVKILNNLELNYYLLDKKIIELLSK